MKVRYRSPDRASLSEHEAKYFVKEQVRLSTGRSYGVYAVSVYDGLAFVHVVDDQETPRFLPRALFEVVDGGIPEDWQCNLFPEGPVQMVFGPAYVAADLGCYEATVDQRRPQMAELWRRVEADCAEPEE